MAKRVRLIREEEAAKVRLTRAREAQEAREELGEAGPAGIFVDVTSTCIADVGYNPLSEDLVLTFVNGGTYLYNNVPIQTFRDFITSPSIGRAFWDLIKNMFGFTRIA